MLFALAALAVWRASLELSASDKGLAWAMGLLCFSATNFVGGLGCFDLCNGHLHVCEAVVQHSASEKFKRSVLGFWSLPNPALRSLHSTKPTTPESLPACYGVMVGMLFVAKRCRSHERVRAQAPSETTQRSKAFAACLRCCELLL